MKISFQRDIQSIFERDPAARSVLEIVLCYPATCHLGTSLAHWLWVHDYKLLGRWVSQLVRSLTGIEIHPGCNYRKRFLYRSRYGGGNR